MECLRYREYRVVSIDYVKQNIVTKVLTPFFWTVKNLVTQGLSVGRGSQTVLRERQV
jgi:hypothetical protein